MKTKVKYFFLLAIFLISGCGSADEGMAASTTFYDEYNMKISINALRQSNIPFKIENNIVWYSVDKAKDVQKIFRSAAKSGSIPFTFPDSLTRDKYLELLQKARIDSFSENKGDDEYIVYVENKKLREASKFFREIILKK